LFPFEQELELYHYAESLCSQKARVGLAEKQLDYRSRHIVLCDIAEDSQSHCGTSPAPRPPFSVNRAVRRLRN